MRRKKRPIVIAKELNRTEASVIERTAKLKRVQPFLADRVAGLQNQKPGDI
jgi:hypothetical protein